METRWKIEEGLKLVVVGDALVDIAVPVDRLVPAGVMEREICVRPGGTANVAIWAARLKVQSAFVGKVGNDILGDMFYNGLVIDRVIPLLAKSMSPTGICISLINQSGERSMIVQRGANDRLSKKDMLAFLEQFDGCEYAYFSAFSLQRKKPAEAVEYLMKHLRKHKIEICLGGGAPNVVSGIRNRILRIADRYVDLLFLNSEEAATLSREEDEKSTLRFLGSHSDEVAITKGELGCVVWNNGEVVRTPTKKVKALDTTGAGDAFAAAYIVSKLRGDSIEQCTRSGNKLASNVVRTLGPS